MTRILSSFLILSAVVRAGALEDATEHFRQGRFKEALEAAGNVQEKDATAYAKARYLMGEIQFMLGDPEASEESLRAALEKRRASPPILTALGRVLFAQGRYDDAIALLEQATAADPKSGRARCFLGVARLRTSYGKKGRKDIRAGIKLSPNDPEIARAVVLTWLQEEDLKQAAAEARRFAKARKKHPMGPFLQALVHEQERKYEEAIEAYERAIGLDDNFLDAHKNLAILCIAQNPLYTDKKRTDKAFKHFKRYFDLGGKDEKVKKIYAMMVSFLGGRR